jgi:hypothetical protein
LPGVAVRLEIVFATDQRVGTEREIELKLAGVPIHVTNPLPACEAPELVTADDDEVRPAVAQANRKDVVKFGVGGRSESFEGNAHARGVSALFLERLCVRRFHLDAINRRLPGAEGKHVFAFVDDGNSDVAVA